MIRVVTSGCFDVLHVGHLRLLHWAKQHGDELTVFINSDSSIRALKGPDRPIHDENERREMLRSIRPVDRVAVFSTPDPTPILTAFVNLHYQDSIVYVKGDDYCGQFIPERIALRDAIDGVLFFPKIIGYSTTEEIRRIKS